MLFRDLVMTVVMAVLAAFGMAIAVIGIAMLAVDLIQRYPWILS